MNLKIPLDQAFSGVFTDVRSGERTPTGAVRRGLRPSPHRSRGESGIGARTVFTATSHGLPDSLGRSGATTSRRPPREIGAGVGSDRACGHLRVTEETETCWAFEGHGATRGQRMLGETTGHARHLRVTSDMSPSGGRWHDASGRRAGTELWSRSRRNWGHPNWTQRGRFRLAPGPRARATGSA